MLATFRELYEYNRWANGRVLDATSRLSAAQFTRDLRNSFASVRDTLVHMLGAEWIWLSRWRGVSPRGVPEGWADSTHEQLRARWREVEADQAAFLASLTEDALDRVVSYTNTRGQPFANPLAALLLHAVNHSTYHRGQLTTMLRQLDAQPVSTDLVRFYREALPSAPAAT